MNVRDLAISVKDRFNSSLSFKKKQQSVAFNSTALYTKHMDIFIDTCVDDPASKYYFLKDKEKTLGELKVELVKLFNNQPRPPMPEHLKSIEIGNEVLSKDAYHIIKNGYLMPQAYEKLRAKLSDDEKDLLLESMVEMVVEFDPHKPKNWKDTIKTPAGPEEYPHYNRYIRPIWRREPCPEDLSSTRNICLKFFKHFIPDEKERNYVIFWLYKLMYEKCEDVLILIGVQGNGKNTFMDLASIVCGFENAITASKSFGKDKFNSEVRKRKLVCLDEYVMKDTQRESLKNFCNDRITVEAKGADPQTVNNHCSFIVANNRESNVHIEYRDRRFSVLNLANKNLADVWGEDEVQKFKQLMKTDDFQISFPHFIAKYVEDNKISFPKFKPLITSKFDEVVEVSKPNWFKAMKYLLENKGRCTSQDIYRQTRTRVSDYKIQEQIDKEVDERRHRGFDSPEFVTVDVDDGKTVYLKKGGDNETLS